MSATPVGFQAARCHPRIRTLLALLLAVTLAAWRGESGNSDERFMTAKTALGGTAARSPAAC
jgi:hypothetical protein